MPKAMIIPADESKPIRIENVCGLDEMQIIVAEGTGKSRGWIELVPLTLRLAGNVVEVSLFCHEEGKLEGLPLNRRATEMAKGNLQPGDYLAGDVFLTGAPDENGDETDVPLPDCFKPA